MGAFPVSAKTGLHPRPVVRDRLWWDTAASRQHFQPPEKLRENFDVLPDVSDRSLSETVGCRMMRCREIERYSSLSRPLFEFLNSEGRSIVQLDSFNTIVYFTVWQSYNPFRVSSPSSCSHQYGTFINTKEESSRSFHSLAPLFQLCEI